MENSRFTWQILLGFCLLALVPSISVALSPKKPLKNYSAILQHAVLKGVTKQSQIAIRSWLQGNQHFFLVVNPNNLRTKIVKKEELAFEKKKSKNTRYSRSLRQKVEFSKIDAPLFNPGNWRYSLTVDLCPSRKPWDGDLFKKVIARSKPKPADIGLAVTGRWIKTHAKEFAKLKAWNREKKLNITWINHSYSHPLRPDHQGRYHFMTSNSVNMQTEIFRLEKLLISHGETPSIWFRFPGLVYNQKLLNKVNQLGLIALGSDSWVAKDQRITNGSILLLHGNGNERSGIRKFYDFLGSSLARKSEMIGLNQWFE